MGRANGVTADTKAEKLRRAQAIVDFTCPTVCALPDIQQIPLENRIAGCFLAPEHRS
jgi:hypothetical protein